MIKTIKELRELLISLDVKVPEQGTDYPVRNDYKHWAILHEVYKYITNDIDESFVRSVAIIPEEKIKVASCNPFIFIEDNKIIKRIFFSEKYGSSDDVKEICEYIIGSNNPDIVKIFRFELEKHWYEYEMEVLNPLSEAEKSGINDAIRSHISIPTYIINSCTSTSNRIKEDYVNKINAYRFAKHVIANMNYCDVHPGNIMKANDGGYKVIDVESFSRASNVENIKVIFNK